MNPHPLTRWQAMDEGRKYEDSFTTINALVKTKTADPHTIAKRLKTKQSAGYAKRT